MSWRSLAVFPALCSTAVAALTADTILVNASLRTMDRTRPRAEAIAILGNRIAAVGTTAEIRALAGPDTRVIDASGKLVLPGFNDSHVHFLSGGAQLSGVDLRDATSPAELARRIGEHAKKLPPGRWIVGGNWDHEKWPGTPLPTRRMIDDVTPAHPVFVSRTDGHMALANSLALRLAGVTRDTKDPAGGVIVRSRDGEPEGVLKDGALDLVSRVIPPKSFEENLEAARAATRAAARLGVTSVHDMSAGADVGVYQHLLERGELLTRIYAVRSILSWETLAKAGVRGVFGSDLLRIGGLKGFADGSLGSSTALFFAPYADAPHTRGLLFPQMIPEGAMLNRVLAADQAGLHVMIHAIGDEANRRILDLYQEVRDKHGDRDRRFRIEHAQHLRHSEIPRFAAQRVIASMQPFHAIDDGRWCERRIGPERAKGAYAFRSLLDAGAVLAFGSDWDVAPLDPLAGIHAAVTRRTLDGKHPDGWVPEQKITLEEAIHAYTVGSAYAEWAENHKGTLTPDKLADLVVLDRDLFALDPAQIEHARVVLTIMDGRVVFEADPRASSPKQPAPPGAP